MKNKKGFTLIELLAVIVILAIIALIATPIILNMIEDSRKGAATDSAYGYLQAIDYQNSLSGLDENKYPSYKTGNYSVEDLNVKNIKGTKPTSGTVYIENKIIKNAELCIDGYKVIYNGEKVTEITKSSECVANKETNDNSSTESGNNSGTDSGGSSTDTGNNPGTESGDSSNGTESGETVVKNYVAQISTTKYETVQEAINAVPSNNTETTLLLLENVTENVTVAQNQNIVFDLNQKVLTGKMVNNGSINVKNGEITNLAANAIINYGTIVLNGATISCEAPSNAAISNRKALTVNSGTILGVNNTAITSYDGATITLNDGNILSTNYTAISNAGEVNILGGNLKSLKVTINNKATGVLNVSGGTMTLNSTSGTSLIGNVGKVNVSGTAVLKGISTSSSTISNQSGGILNISGGEISSTKKIAILIYDGAEANISGGTLTSSGSNVLKNEGTCKITNGTFVGTSSSTATMHNIGTMIIENGTFTAESSGAMAMYNNGKLTITGGTFTSARNSIYNEVGYSGVISVSGAIANGPTFGY